MGELIDARDRFIKTAKIVPPISKSTLLCKIHTSHIRFVGIFDDPSEALNTYRLEIGDSILVKKFGDVPLYYVGDDTFCRGLIDDVPSRR